jgi:hypothetical protein
MNAFFGSKDNHSSPPKPRPMRNRPSQRNQGYHNSHSKDQQTQRNNRESGDQRHKPLLPPLLVAANLNTAAKSGRNAVMLREIRYRQRQREDADPAAGEHES